MTKRELQRLENQLVEEAFEKAEKVSPITSKVIYEGNVLITVKLGHTTREDIISW